MLQIIEIIRKMEQGFTEPYLCRAEDDELYVIKRANATYKGLVKEWVSASLGKEFGLPIPDFKLVYVDNSLLEYDDELRHNIGAGIAFASKLVGDLQEVTYSDLLSGDSDLLKSIFMFDYWIKNDDRNLSEIAGNPNLFLSQSTKEIIVLDHNLSFDRDFDLNSFKDIHVGAQAFNTNVDMLLEDEFTPKFSHALSKLDEIFAQIPEDWKENFDNYDDFLGEIRVILYSFEQTNFWEVLI